MSLKSSSDGFLSGRPAKVEGEEEDFPYYLDVALDDEEQSKRTRVWDVVMCVAEDVEAVGDAITEGIQNACRRASVSRSLFRGGKEESERESEGENVIESETVEYLKGKLLGSGRLARAHSRTLLSDSLSGSASSQDGNEDSDEVTAQLEEHRQRQREEMRRRLQAAPLVSHALPHPPTPVQPTAELVERLEDDELAPAHKKILLSLPVSICCPSDFTLVCLTTDMSPASALDMLAEKDILSAPVRHHKTKKVVGSLDVLDLVTYLLDLCKVNSELDMQREFEKSTIADLAAANVDKFVQLDHTDNLYRAFQVFSAGYHRIHVVHDDRIIAVLSQSSVIDLLAHEPRLLGHKAQKTLDELHAARPRKNLYAVHTQAKTYVAFDLMARHQVSAVPIVTAENKLVGALESRDIKGMHLGTFVLLTYGVKEYKDIVLRQETHMSTSFATIKPTDTLFQAVKLLSQKRTHRLWVVSDDGKLLGLLSLGDLLHCISAIEEDDV
eukprot:CAMPEP_0114628438 /NCGR_PEP_ID=MMETSP0168-20121206/12821_1 /TAXON_ID=95228 ORGANISM="Vannella sp., Strain DIVA3 517/6/12" /NCGR_SAMPLE_ID=MMETSP0168 /ASSEMBLY_ACC=CAM_ASM_000044 /LENGTH=497 /DNA_ID=CAMNT_0001839821 /DNA_START=93 /DNA_END=1586 /DNA_ORIENTATION=-